MPSLPTVPALPLPSAQARQWAVKADLLDFTAQPQDSAPQDSAVRYRPAHWLLVDGTRIAAVQANAPGDDWWRVDASGHLLLPGFIDAHVHGAQLDVIGAWGSSLLDWLTTHTFPAEARFASLAHARAHSALFLDSLLAVGTTAAVVYPSVHAHSVDALFEAAQARGMRMVSGKVMMDRHVPAAVRDTVASAERECRALIERWHGQGRAAYAVTPRFAPTSSEAQLALAGQLLRSAPGLYLQTHLAETQAELAWVKELFPQDRSYLWVYERHGLLGERSVLGHGIWLDEVDRRLLHDRGAQLVHCPSSNLFLGSGLFDWRALRAAGVAFSVASDVGGGTQLCLRRNLLEAYKIQMLLGHKLSAWALLHSATRGAAQALQLAHEMGGLEPGQCADFNLWAWGSSPLAQQRQSVAQNLHERMFAWLTMAEGSDRLATFVAGRALAPVGVVAGA
jgi:guanine deaminase